MPAISFEVQFETLSTEFEEAPPLEGSFHLSTMIHIQVMIIHEHRQSHRFKEK